MWRGLEDHGRSVGGDHHIEAQVEVSAERVPDRCRNLGLSCARVGMLEVDPLRGLEATIRSTTRCGRFFARSQRCMPLPQRGRGGRRI